MFYADSIGGIFVLLHCVNPEIQSLSSHPTNSSGIKYIHKVGNCSNCYHLLVEYRRDKLIVAGRVFFSRVAGFIAGRGFLTKIAFFFAGIFFFAGFFSQVLISCYAVLARGGGEMYNIGAQTNVFFSKYKVYFLVFY